MLTLGIDIGTTKSAAVICDSSNPANFHCVSAAHGAALPSPEGRAFQSPEAHWQCLLSLIAQLPREELAKVEAIGFTGQMHSLVCWNDNGDFSPVVTWQDKAASTAGTLDDYRARTGLKLADGFGGVSLSEFARTGELSRWNHAANPVDWMAMKLCGNANAVTDWTFAASWGIWDAESKNWNLKAAEILGIPAAMLPAVVAPGTVIGKSCGVPGLPEGIPVYAALGDNQASILATADDADNELFMTIGTGAQLSAVLTAEEAAAHTFPPQIELRPFVNGRVLAVNAPLCGGKSWAWLGESVNSILQLLGATALPAGALLDKLDEMALNAENCGLVFSPLFLGERHQPESRASISGITLENFTLPALARSLAAGIVATLVKPFPAALLEKRRRIIGSGNCLRLCKSIQAETTTQSGLPISFNDLPEEAARGAAKLAFVCAG